MTRLAPLLGVAALLGTVLLCSALFGVEAHHDGGEIAFFGAIYGALGLALAGCLFCGARLGPSPTWIAAWLVSLPLVYHVRELNGMPRSILAVPVVALLIALPFGMVARRLPRPTTFAAPIAALICGALGCAALAWSAAEGSDLRRWHLLRHHKMVGTPAYYLFMPPIDQLETALFDAHRDGAPRVESPRPTPGGEFDNAPPHLVFILLDTLRADALALGGGDPARMPRLNQALEGAWRFSNVHANASWTRPSMASFFTGLRPEEHGARDVDDPLEEELDTLPELLRERGYRTAAFVSNVGAVGRGAGFAQGFDFFHEFEHAEPYARASQVRRTAAAWLEDQPTDGPLFLYLHFLDPHEPYLAGKLPARETKAEYLAAYDAELAYLDAELAALFAELDILLPGPWALVIASDHGEEFFEHEEFGHGQSLYRELLHVPVAFRPPGAEGGELDAPLEARDFFDLLLAWTDAEAAASATFDVPGWARTARREHRDASIYYSSSGRLILRPYLAEVCMRRRENGRHALIWSAYGDTLELYDIVDDPGEQRNLILHKPDLARNLRDDFDQGLGPWRFPAAYERTPEEFEQLRNLGYLD